VATREVFSDEEINRAELIRHFTLTGADEAFVRRFRGQGNTLGAAVQLCVLPWLGFVPDEVRSAPAAAVVRLSERLGIPVGALREYGVREQTRTDHLREVTRYLGWRTMDELAWKQLQEFLFARAMEHDAPRLLFRLACEYLASARLIRPGLVNLLERIATAREQARAETWARVEYLLDDARCAELDETYRRRIARQLNKGENLHSLRRELAYAGEGAVRRRHHEQQTEQMWCLTLATNAIVTWTTEYYGLAIAALRRGGRGIDDEVLAHLWPCHHENVHFYGNHTVDIDGELAKLDADGYRPLRALASTPTMATEIHLELQGGGHVERR